MPLYGSQTGMPTPVYPGQQFTLFGGTEAPAAGLKSVAFERTANWSGTPSPMVFTSNFASAPTATVQIQGSNDDTEANYQTIQAISTQHGYYSDLGNFRFYRAVLSAYGAGGQPVVTVQR